METQQDFFKPVNYRNNSKLELKFYNDYWDIIANEMNPLYMEYNKDADFNDVADLIVTLPYGNTTVKKAVGFRVRNYSYYESYKHQFTFREKELEKILMGKGDYYLYGFCDNEQRKLIHWTFFNLDQFRRKYNEYIGQPNWDPDTTKFYAFNFWRFPDMIIKEFSSENRYN